MKRLFFIVTLGSMLGVINAQIDTINNKNHELDSAEILLSTADFGKSCKGSAAGYTFAFSKFTALSKKGKPNKTEILRIAPHTSTLFIGFAGLSNRDFSHFDEVSNAVLRYASWELGFNLISEYVKLSPKYPWLLWIGAGFRYMEYKADDNSIFILNERKTIQLYDEIHGYSYIKKSRLSCWYFSIPLMLEYQKPRKGPDFYFQAGIETSILLSARSVIKQNYPDEKRDRKVILGKGMNINPLAVDARIGIGFGNIGLYFRYGLLPLFRKGRGAEVIPIETGITLNF
jgi:hypothetical protein